MPNPQYYFLRRERDLIFLKVGGIFYPMMEVLEPRNLDHCSPVGFSVVFQKVFEKVSGPSYHQNMSGENEGWEPPENNISKDLQVMRKLGKSAAFVRKQRTSVPEITLR